VRSISYAASPSMLFRIFPFPFPVLVIPATTRSSKDTRIAFDGLATPQPLTLQSPSLPHEHTTHLRARTLYLVDQQRDVPNTSTNFNDELRPNRAERGDTIGHTLLHTTLYSRGRRLLVASTGNRVKPNVYQVHPSFYLCENCLPTAGRHGLGR
jgi:hypothetical protein